MIRLRPHHGMCLAFFRGAGYSGAFTRNMTAIQARLAEHPRILLTAGADDICAACPNLKNGICTEQEKVIRYDQAVLDLCGLEPGRLMDYGEFQALVARNILKPGRREEICGDCQWSQLCHF